MATLGIVNMDKRRQRDGESWRERAELEALTSLGLAPAIAAWRGDLGGEALAGWRLAQRRCVGRGRGCFGLVWSVWSPRNDAVVPIARLLRSSSAAEVHPPQIRRTLPSRLPHAMTLTPTPSPAHMAGTAHTRMPVTS